MILSHYTNAKGLAGILATQSLHASTAARNPNDVHYGDGQYLSDIVPGSKSSTKLSRHLLGYPFLDHRFTHFVAINVDDLPLLLGRPGVYVIPNNESLDLTGRIVGSGDV